MALGEMLNQGQPQADPQGGQTALPSDQTPFQQRMQGLMQDPSFRAFMLNMAANIAAGNDLGTAAARGAEGMGRMSIAAREMQEQERDRAERERDRQARARRGGGRGGRGSTSELEGLGIPKGLKRKDLVSMYNDQLDALSNSELADELSREELKGLAWIETLAQAGQGAPSQLLAQLQEPSERSQFLLDFSFGPEAGIRKIQETMQQGQAELDLIAETPQPPVDPGAPAQPATPEAPTPVNLGGFAPAPVAAVPQSGLSLGDILTGRKTSSATRKRRDPLDSDIPPP